MPTLLEACQAALAFIETGANPAAGCVAAPTADVAIVEMLRSAIAAAEEIGDTAEELVKGERAGRALGAHLIAMGAANVTHEVEIDGKKIRYAAWHEGANPLRVDENPDEVLSVDNAQNILDEVTSRLNRAGFGYYADGTVYGNGIFVHRLRVREMHETQVQPGERMIPTQAENPEGLHGRYWIRKADGSLCDPDAIYFVLRLDDGGSDPVHIRAGRFAARMYAMYISVVAAEHLHLLAKELSDLCDRLGHDEQVDFPGFNVDELRDMFSNPFAYDCALDYHGLQETQAEAFGADHSVKWHHGRAEFLKTKIAALNAKAEE